MNNIPTFSNASLHWDEDNLPHSLVYGDIYFSKADALGESSHVFLEGNNLPQRWRELQTYNFIIGELGFGAGVNFLNTCRLWCSVAPVGAHLHYVACELHPFVKADMQRLHAVVPELEDFSRAFLQLYPDHTPGVHQMELVFGSRHVSLTLLYGDAEQMLGTMYKPDGVRMDCWFLDGFSPKCNPAMWQPSLLGVIARLSKADTTLTTYSVAGALRRTLTEAGFSLCKRPGYANKRHMLFARLHPPAETQITQLPTYQLLNLHGADRNRTVCIIGAGLAGCSAAFALARRGWKVTVLEREAGIAMQGSGNAQGILHYRPSKADTAERRFNLHAYLYAVRHYRMLGAVHQFAWQQCGMLQLAVNQQLLARYEALIKDGHYAEQVLQLVDANQASQIAGRSIHLPALYLPESGWMAPRKLCELYLQHPTIELHTGVEVVGMNSSESGWNIEARSGEQFTSIQTQNIILCNAADAYACTETRHYPIVCNLGQVDYYAANEATKLHTVICGQGYILPSDGEHQSIGGSFFVGDKGKEASEARRIGHINAIRAMDRATGEAIAHSALNSQRIGIRCATPDRMPIVGAVTSPKVGMKTVLPGLYINIAHGSHGLTRTPLCAAYLASLLDRTPFPASNDVVRVIAPDRF